MCFLFFHFFSLKWSTQGQCKPLWRVSFFQIRISGLHELNSDQRTNILWLQFEPGHFLCFSCLNDENSLGSDDEIKFTAVYLAEMTRGRQGGTQQTYYTPRASDTGWDIHKTVFLFYCQKKSKTPPHLLESLFKQLQYL